MAILAAISMRKTRLRILLWPTIFSLAFGYIEAAVVVYLRELYYPGGFQFPLIRLPEHILLAEVAREQATLLLLFSVAVMATKENLRRFAVFIYCFGVWDLVYYLMLKVILDWPSSLLEWDILFLIPLPWTGPVLAPMLVAACLVVTSVLIFGLPANRPSPFRPKDWAIAIGASLVIIASFLWNLPALVAHDTPHFYPWWLFLIGYIGGTGWFAWRFSRA